MITKDPDRPQEIEGARDYPAFVCFMMGIGYQLGGDPVHALDSYDLFSPGKPDNYLVVTKLLLQSMALDQLGRLAEAERYVRAALAQPDLLDEEMAHVGMVTLGSVLLRRGLSEEGAAWLGDYRVEIDDGPFGYFSCYELGWAAVRRGDVETAQTFADRLDILTSATKLRAHLRVCAALLRGAVAGLLGDEDRAGELLNGALVDARGARLGEWEIVALTQLADWHLRGRRLPEARGHAWNAVGLAERAELRLRCADALNVRSRVERASGETKAAAQTANDAYHKACCDGPPFSYAAGLDEARANLSAVGAPEPSCLGFEPGEPFPEVLIKPTPRPELT